MRKALPYVIAGAVLVIIGLLLVYGNRWGAKTFDERLTLKQKDKIPYGTTVAHELLPSLFPGAVVVKEQKAPGNWESISTYESQQAVILVAKNFNASETELEQLLLFVKEGNTVFIIARDFSYETQRFFGFSSAMEPFEEYISGDSRDSLIVQLEPLVFGADTSYVYPGRRFQGYITDYDTARTVVLGTNPSGQPQFLRFDAGDGSFFIHTAPMAFSNYFILHKQNIDYFRQAFSVIPEGTEKLAWNDYYLRKPQKAPKKSGRSVLSVLMGFDAFRYGLLTALALLGIFLLMEMRRRQRMIPVHHRPRNESLDFVRTMGRLYHDKRDHANLAHKMSNYFLEHVRSRYKLPTTELDNEFVKALQYKSGYSADGISSIVAFINALAAEPKISEVQLAAFHRQLELFYQNE